MIRLIGPENRDSLINFRRRRMNGSGAMEHLTEHAQNNAIQTHVCNGSSRYEHFSSNLKQQRTFEGIKG